MKILLDECITKKLKFYLNNFEVFTVTEMGWSGVKNGKLMSLCAENQFNLLITIDKNLMFQQNLQKYPLTIVVFNCKTSKIEELIRFLPSLKKQIGHMETSKAYYLEE